MLFRTHGIAGSARARCAWPGTVVALQADAVGSVLGHFRTAWDPVPYLHRSPSPSTGRRNATVRKRFSESRLRWRQTHQRLPTGCVRRALAYQLHKLRHEVGKKKREDGGQDDGKRQRDDINAVRWAGHHLVLQSWPSRARGRLFFPYPLTSSGTALVNDIIAPLHFAHDPMQQAGSDRFVLAKLRRDVLKKGFAAGYGFGCLHQPVEIVVGEAQSKLIERGHSKLHTKNCECRNRTLVQTAILPLS